MVGRRIHAALAVLVIAGLLVGAAPAAATLVGGDAPAATTDCQTTALHDQYRFDNRTVRAAANDSAFSQVQNTRVEIHQVTGFLRLHAENPNGYCVRYVVEIAPKVVSPAELGTIDAVDSNATASWHAVRDFQRSTTYTEVAFSLGPGQNATFAPSSVRVQILS